MLQLLGVLLETMIILLLRRLIFIYQNPTFSMFLCFILSKTRSRTYIVMLVFIGNNMYLVMGLKIKKDMLRWSILCWL